MTANPARHPPALVLAVGIGIFLGIFPNYIVPFLVGSVVDGLGFTETQAGLLATLEIAAVATTAITVSPFVAKISLQRLGLSGVIVAAFAQFASTAVEHFYGLALLRFFVGIGLGCAYAAVNAATGSVENPGRLYGLALALALALGTLMFPLIGMAVLYGGHVGAYALAGLIVLLCLPAMGGLVTATVRRLPATYVPAFPFGKFLALGAIIVLFNLGMGPVWAFTERIGAGIGLSPDRIGFFLSIASVAGMLGALSMSWLNIHFGRLLPLVTASLLGGLSAVAVATATEQNSYLWGTVLYSFFYSFLYSFLLAIGASLDSTGRIPAACAGLIQIVYAMGPVLGGMLVAIGNYPMIGSFGFVCSAAAVAVAIAFRNELATAKSASGPST